MLRTEEFRKSTYLLKGFLSRFSVLLLLVLSVPSTIGAESSAQQILLINSYRQSMTWVSDIVRAVRDELSHHEDPVTLQIEYMDAKRYHDQRYFDSLARHYSVKYSETSLDLIMVSDNHAYEFILEHRDQLFPGVPVVFAGVNDFIDRQLEGRRGITGVVEAVDAVGTLNVALRLFPGTRQVYVLNDDLKSGRAWRRQMSAQLEYRFPDLTFTYAESLPLEQQKQVLSNLPANSIVLLGAYFADSTGYSSTYEKIGASLANESSAPVFCLLEFNLGDSIIGGRLVSAYRQGQLMARIGKRILAGVAADEIEVMTEGVNQYIFNASALKRWHISRDQLPPDSLVINDRRTLYQQYQIEIWLASLFVAILMAAIVVLILSIRSRVEVERKLRESNQRFHGIFNQTFQFIGLLAPDGSILDANNSALDTVGMDLESVQGMKLSDSPWFAHSEREQARIRKAIQQAARGEFVRMEVTHKSRDGEMLNVDFSLKPVFDEQGAVVLLIPEGRDISELKRTQAELQDSKRKLEQAVEDQSFLLDNINDFIYRHDLDGNFLYVSPSIRRITGYAPQEWSINFRDTLTDSEINRDVEAFTEDALATGQPHPPYEIEVRHKAGHAVRLEISERPYKEQERIIGMVGVARDVTDRARAERAVRELSQFQRTIIDNAEVWLAVYDAEGKVTIWNRTAERISGYGIQEVGSRENIMRMIYPDATYREEISKRVFHALSNGEPLEDLHATIVCKNGERRSMLWDVRPLSAAGEQYGSMTIGIDVTERERATREAMELRNYLQDVVDSLPSVLVAVNERGEVIQCNEAAEGLTSLKPSDLQGQPIEKVFPWFADYLSEIRHAIASGEPCITTRRVRGDEPGERYEDVSIYPLAGQIRGAVVRVDDVTERVRIEEVMIQSEKMLSVGGLAAGMAHEINNPLAGILQNIQVISNRLNFDLPKNRHVAEECGLSAEGFAEFLRQREIFSMIDSIRQSGMRAARIVENMLSFSRKGGSDYMPHDLAELIDRTIELANNDYDLKKRHDFRRIRVVREYAEDLPMVTCEASQIQQVLLNVLKNAAQAMSESVEPVGEPTIKIRIHRKAHHVQIDIQDNGPGIPSVTQKRVFEPFFTTKQVGLGTGLGLSVSYFIVSENHGGTMSVSSAPGEGACFSICLPV